MQKTTKDRIALIDILKAISMIFIIIGHTGWEGNQRNVFGFPFWVDMAVPVFMILSGFVFAMSFDKRGINLIDEAYSVEYVLKNLLRFLVPYILVYFFEIIGGIYIGWFEGTGIELIGSILLDMVRGGAGVGSYYVPVMIQFIFLYPLIWQIYKKSKKPNMIMLMATLAFEFLKFVLYIPESGYRLLVFRYVFLIGFGTYIYLRYSQKKQMEMKYWICAPIGAFFIIATCYLGYESRFFCYWTGTCVIASMFIMPFVGGLIDKMSFIKFRPAELIGRASYNIFMVQQIWFLVGAQIFLFPLVKCQLLRVIISCIVCIVVGIIYYMVESRITNGLIGRLITNRGSNRKIKTSAD